MSGTGPTGLPQLFNELHRCCQNQEYARIIQVANRILQDSPQDVDAFRCKLLAMIQQGAFNDALVLIDKHSSLSDGLGFEKAYAEYRLNRLNESLETLTKCSVEGLSHADVFRINELKAQIFYRLEKYEDCLKLYKELIKESEDDYEEERMTNVSAVAAALHLQEQRAAASTVDAIIHEGEKGFERSFNLAFADISRGNYREAETKLRHTETVCRQSFEDDPEALEEEMVVIRVQLAYVLQMQGRINEATNLYNAVLKLKTSDPAVLAVASNNSVTLNRDQNIFDSKRKMKTATSSSVVHKLLSRQQTCIAINHALILMYSGQGDASRKLIGTLLEKETDMQEELTLVIAASFLREKKNSEAFATLEEFVAAKKAKNRNSECLRAALALVQLHLQQGSISLAVERLKYLGEGTRFRLGVVATVVALLKNMEDKDAAVDYLSSAIAFNKKENRLSDSSLEMLMRECASTMLSLGQNSSAVTLLEELRTKAPRDLRLLAQLITAYATIDPVKAQKVSRDLPSPEEMAHGVNVDELEAHCFASGPKYSRKTQTKDDDKKTSPSVAGVKAGATELLLSKSKKRRKRRGKLPKNFDPKSDPDPERWLPRKDRSNYKGRRRDKRKDGGIGKGTQGGVGTVEGLDASKPAPGAVPKAASPPTASPTLQSTGGKSVPQQQQQSQQKASGSGGNKGKKPQGKKKKKGW